MTGLELYLGLMCPVLFLAGIWIGIEIGYWLGKRKPKRKPLINW